MEQNESTGLILLGQPENLTQFIQLTEQLGEAAERYHDMGVQGSANTQRAYAADLRSYEAYCEEKQLQPYPAGLATLSRYLAHLADRLFLPKNPKPTDAPRHHKMATVLRHLAAI